MIITDLTNMGGVRDSRRRMMMETYARRCPYVTDGLLLCYDGIHNGKTGHDSASRIWYDWSGNGNDLPLLEEFSFGDDYLTGTWDGNGQKQIAIEFPYEVPQDGYSVEIVGKNNGIFMRFSNSLQMTANYNILSLNGLGGRNSRIDMGIAGTTAAYENTFAWYYTQALIGFGSQTSYVKGEEFQTLNNTLHPSQFLSFRWAYYGKKPINAIRIYNRLLTLDELRHNYRLDVARFNI